jgi:single-stranded-DNA-specific exonuclease
LLIQTGLIDKKDTMEKCWSIRIGDETARDQLVNALGLHPLIARLLVNRGVTEPLDAENFLKSGLDGLIDPFLMKDMDVAVARIRKARDHHEKVLVFGDYDVDGVTSSTVLHQALVKLGIDVMHHIPHRMTDGYGLNHEIALFAREQGVSLLISIDCGTTAVSEIEGLQTQGIDVIVIDHHQPDQGILPPAVALVNPKRPGCPYPFKELASVGLAFKVTQALFGRIPEEVLDLVTIGTVADVVPLVGENRILVKNGLPCIAKTANIGLQELLAVSKIQGKTISPFSIGFVLGPRINASGRMDSALIALDLFLSGDRLEARRLAGELNRLNLERQKTQREVVQEALEIVEATFDADYDKVIVLGKEGWHKGVLGIVASRLTEKYERPSVVISIKDGMGTASARSVQGFHLHEALTGCAECLENFGGHQGAAGLTIRAENVDPFRDMINRLARAITVDKPLLPMLNIDAEIPLTMLDVGLIHSIDQLEPFGEGNPQPVFCAHGLMVKSYPSVMGKDTIKFWVTDGSVTISAVGFGMGAKFASRILPGKKIDLCFQVMVDDWKKEPTPQLKIKDIRFECVA